MKNNLLLIIRITAFHILMGFMLQGLGMNKVLASQRQEDGKLEDVKIKMSVGDISLEQALRLIEQQTDLKFFYIKEDVPLGEKIKINRQEGSLYQILQGFAKEFGLAFSRIDHQIVIKKVKGVQPKTYTVGGIVRDGSTHEPLVFTSIVLKGTQQGIATDA